MTTTGDLPLADTNDMIGIHRVFREALAAAPRLVGGATPGDSDRAEVIGTYDDNVLRLLDSHHTGEDELLTPSCSSAAPTTPRPSPRSSASTPTSTLQSTRHTPASTGGAPPRPR